MPSLAARTRSATQHAAELLYRIADGVSRGPFIREHHALPQTIQVPAIGAEIDTVDDLVAFTGLDRVTVCRELQRRKLINFRAEWLATPQSLRSDHWFYLSSKAYLFANASHWPDDLFVHELLERDLPRRIQILEFGGGSGQLALRLAAQGIKVTFVELNALQREFVRFRVARHGLSDLLKVLDTWNPIPGRSFDAVIALDVLEHLPDARKVLVETLLPALRDDGVFIENSPFEADPSNPMHHSDFGFDEFMHDEAFAVVHQREDNTRVWRR